MSLQSELTSLVVAGPEPADVAMQRDRELLDGCARGQLVARVHGWAAPSLTFGKTQKLSDDLLSDLRKHGIAHAKRPTGGGWLLHLPGDVALSLAFGGPLRAGNLRGCAARAANLLAAAFQRLDLDARVQSHDESTPSSRSDVCFARLDREELSVDGVKIAGVALARLGDKALVQTAVPLVPSHAEAEAFLQRWDGQRGEAVQATQSVNFEIFAEALNSVESR